jgi:hypothetical protein
MLYGRVLLKSAVPLKIIAPVNSLGSDGHSSSFESSVTKLVHVRLGTLVLTWSLSQIKRFV